MQPGPRKPRAQRARRAVAVVSVAAALTLGGAMASTEGTANTLHASAAPAAASTSSDAVAGPRYDDGGGSSAGTGSVSNAVNSVVPHTTTRGS